MSDMSDISEQQLYAIGKVAQEKLQREGKARWHNLRRLVGHANLYDKILIILEGYEPPEYDLRYEDLYEDDDEVAEGDSLPEYSAETRAEETTLERSEQRLGDIMVQLEELKLEKRADQNGSVEIAAETQVVEVAEVEVDEDD